MTQEKYLSVHELSDILGVSTRTIHRMKDKGMPHHRVGNLIKFLLSEVMEYTKER